MRTAITSTALLLATTLAAQVVVDTPIELTGPAGERRIDGLAAPQDGSAAITVGTALLGSGHWATSAVLDDTLLLSPTPPIEAMGNGLLLRFLAPAPLSGALFIQVEGFVPLPLHRPDGLHPLPGQLQDGAVAEIILVDGQFVLTAPASRGCPPGWLAVHEGLCIEEQDSQGLNFHEAATHCADRGGRLCSWDEYHVACTLLQGQLLGLFDGWEWIDDTSNHTQTGDQVGDVDCFNQRSAGPLSPFQARCCMKPR
jgi:hypothetical protein